MELQFNKTSCHCLTRVAREVQNEELTQEVRLPDGMPDIGRVLATWGQVTLRSKEWRAGMVSVSGGVMLWVLYAPEDGSDARCVDTWIPFNLKWDVSSAEREGAIRVLPLLRFADSRALSARKMMVRAGVAAMGDILCQMEAEVYQAEEVPGDVELLKNTYPARIPKESGEKTFLLDEDLTLPNSMPAPEKLLSYTIQPEVTEKKVMVGKAVFKGNGNLHLIYRCADGKVRTWDFELPFSQFQELDGEHGPEASLDTAMAVTSLELDLGEEGRLRLKCGLVCQYLVDDCCMLELTEDAYSPRRQVEVQMDSLRLPAILDDRRENITAEQSVQGQSGQVVDVTFLPDFPRQRRTGDEITFELPGMFQVLYYGEDDSLQAFNARWEGSCSLGAGEDSRIDAVVVPMGSPSAMASGDAMELQGQLRLVTSTTAERGIPMVTGLELGELQEPDQLRPSLILCRPEGEGLWQLAKRCGSTVAAIRQANALEGEPGENQMLLIPVS